MTVGCQKISLGNVGNLNGEGAVQERYGINVEYRMNLRSVVGATNPIHSLSC